jgi:allantoicase
MATTTSSAADTASFERLTDLASRKFGARVLFATDEWFAAAHLLLSPEPAVFLPDEFTPYGKWMDGWETRRKRVPGHDWCIIELGLRGTITAVDVDTAFFTGNNAPRVSIQAARFSSDKSEWPLALQKLSDRAPVEREMGRCATSDEQALADELETAKWQEIVPFSGAYGWISFTAFLIVLTSWMVFDS